MQSESLLLPAYTDFMHSLAVLALPITLSVLHGQLCGLLCVGQVKKGEDYLLTLMGQPKNESTRGAALALFQLFAVSQQQIMAADFSFQLLLPEDEAGLLDRAQAFSEWCEGFIQGLEMADFMDEELDTEGLEALEHIREFAALDCDSLDVDDEDEKALMEVSEFTRVAVIRLHHDLISEQQESRGSQTAH